MRGLSPCSTLKAGKLRHSFGTRSRMGRAKIDAAQNDARRIALKLEVMKFQRRAFFDPVAQS
jgi:hypothetical protein